MSERPPEHSESETPQPSTLEQLKNFARDAASAAAREPDVNTVEIGAGARVEQIAVGRNILQAKINIGALVVPVRFLLALVGVALVVAAAAWFYFVPAQMPLDTTNIAVANFGQVDAQGNAQDNARARELSAWLYGKLQSEKSGLPDGTKLTVWNDAMTFLEKRAPLGRVDNEAQAMELANRVGADMVIYGNLDVNQDPAQFVPQFYVRQAGREADELTGTQPLGKKLIIDKSVPELKDYLDLNLKPRADAVLWFARGIGLDALGEYGRAYQLFCNADMTLTNWDATQGREILYYFMGREALFAGRTDARARATETLGPAWGTCTPFHNAAEATDAAQQWFEKSKSINDNYARAYFGIGQAHAQRANAIVRDRARDMPGLETARTELGQAIENFQAALDRLPQDDSDSLVDLKTRAAMGAAYILSGQTYVLANQADAANHPLEPALSELERAETILEPLTRAIPADQTRFRAQVYLTLGVARRLRGHTFQVLNDAVSAKDAYTHAADDFAQCLEIGKREPNDDFLQNDVLPNCTREQNEVTQALSKF